MTVEEWITQYLTTSGLWPQEVEAVIETIKEDESWSALAGMLPGPRDGYPVTALMAAKITIDHLAVEYIDEHAPQHFAREMFSKDG